MGFHSVPRLLVFCFLAISLPGCSRGNVSCYSEIDSHERKQLDALKEVSPLALSEVCASRPFSAIDSIDLQFAISKSCNQVCSEEQVDLIVTILSVAMFERILCDDEDPYLSSEARHAQFFSHLEGFMDAHRAFIECARKG